LHPHSGGVGRQHWLVLSKCELILDLNESISKHIVIPCSKHIAEDPFQINPPPHLRHYLLSPQQKDVTMRQTASGNKVENVTPLTRLKYF
jgi:hypothetical protein